MSFDSFDKSIEDWISRQPWPLQLPARMAVGAICLVAVIAVSTPVIFALLLAVQYTAVLAGWGIALALGLGVVWWASSRS